MSGSLSNSFVSNFSWLLIAIVVPYLYKKIIDCFDTTQWKVDLRKLQRGGELKRDDKIRISFAYLFRIKVDGKYLLVLNKRGTKKYQPVGGAYQYDETELAYLCNKYKIAEDNKIARDEISRNDYRLFIPVRYLRGFVKRFDNTLNRESVADLSREFVEELIKTGIVGFDSIRYRVCGRYISKIVFSRHFRCYELLIADIVEIILTNEQRIELKKLTREKNKAFRFASVNEIMSCGVIEGTEQLEETIGDHTIKILQESEDELIHLKGVNRIYEIGIGIKLGEPKCQKNKMKKLY
jgi:hypothetical protein